MPVVAVALTIVERIGEPDAEAIVSATTDLANTLLGLRVISEGVEMEEGRAKINALDREFARGFLFSEPLSALDATRVLFDGAPPGPEGEIGSTSPRADMLALARKGTQRPEV